MSGFKIVEGDQFTRTGRCAAEQTIEKGDPLFRDASTGLIRVATASDASILGYAAHDITTIALETTTPIRYIPATPDVIVEATSDTTLTQAVIGKSCDIAVSSGVFTVNGDASSTDVILLTGMKNGEVNGTLSTTVRFKTNKAQADPAVNSSVGVA